MAGGRPSKFNQKTADEICEKLMGGESLRKICESDDMPDARTVHRWLVVNEEFRQQYTHAREVQADTLFDECLDIADDDQFDTRAVGDGESEREVCNTEFVQRSRLRIDTRKWMAGKLRPKVYGDKVDVNHTGELKHTGVMVAPAQTTTEDWEKQVSGED